MAPPYNGLGLSTPTMGMMQPTGLAAAQQGQAMMGAGGSQQGQAMMAPGGLGQPMMQRQPMMQQQGLGMQRRPMFAEGGPAVGPAPPPGANIANMVTGGLQTPVGGRTDHLPISVPPGSYVIPADVVSALGQGNTQNGIKVLETMPMFRNAIPPNPNGKGVDIMAAGGEFVVPPDIVTRIGQGNMTAGHKVLDAFVKKVRAQNIKTLRSIPGPVKK